jgi:hypothetical protein
MIAPWQLSGALQKTRQRRPGAQLMTVPLQLACPVQLTRQSAPAMQLMGARHSPFISQLMMFELGGGVMPHVEPPP